MVTDAANATCEAAAANDRLFKIIGIDIKKSLRHLYNSFDSNAAVTDFSKELVTLTQHSI